MLTTSLTLSLRPDASATREGDEVVIRATQPPAVVRLKQVNDTLHAALARLSDITLRDAKVADNVSCELAKPAESG